MALLLLSNIAPLSKIRYNYTVKKKKILNNKERDKAIAAYIQGQSTRNLARLFCVDKGVIIRELKKRGIKQRSPGDRNRLYSIDEHAFDKIDNESTAYWLGFIFADGCVYKKSLGLFLKASDIEHIKKFRAFLKSNAPINRSIRVYGEKKYQIAGLFVTHDYLVSKLRELGIETRRPDAIKVFGFIPPHFLYHFIRGFFDGDGCVYKGKTIQVNFVGQKDFITRLKNFFDNRGQKISKHTISDVWYLRFGSIADIRFVREKLYKGASIWLERKKEIIDKI